MDRLPASFRVPPSWLCPISQEIMRDPVIGQDGHSYERENLEMWLKDNATSPITRQPMTLGNLIANHALRHAIEEGIASALAAAPSSLAQASLTTQTIQEQAEVDVFTRLLADDSVHVSISCHGPPLPLVLVLVLDVSGSMGSTCTKNGRSLPEAQFSRLDLVKHSVMTMAAMMRAEDSLCIVTFSDNAKVVMPFTKMTERAKQDVSLALAPMRPEGSTNLWGGIQLGIDNCLRPDLAAANNSTMCVMVLTDGEPTASLIPPRGIIASLGSALRLAPAQLSVFTCGFGMGEALDTVLLRDIASRGQGTYSFIPDGSMVGTVFIHMMANLLSVCANVTCDVTPGSSVNLLDQGTTEHAETQKQQRRCFHVGFCQNQQSRDLIIKLNRSKDKRPMDTLLRIEVSGASGAPVEVTSAQAVFPVGFESARESFVQGIESILAYAERGDFNMAKSTLSSLRSELGRRVREDDRIALLLEDLEHPDANKGQIGKALEFFSEWGRHYLPAVAMAHRQQTAVNFKDASMTLYGGPQFSKLLVQKGERIFLTITPPKPSIPARDPNAAAPSITQYLNAHGGCLSGRSLVAMNNGSLKRMDELQKGDIVFGGGVVRVTVRYRGFQGQLVRFGGLEITPFHPITVAGGNWAFPINVPGYDALFDWEGPVYNLVLDGGVSVMVDGIECISLGHGITGDAVAEHAYFGTQAVIDDLAKMKGFSEGFVDYEQPVFEISPSTGLVHRIFERSSL